MPEWTGRDLNPRPPECKSGVHTRLNYRPITARTEIMSTTVKLNFFDTATINCGNYVFVEMKIRFDKNARWL